MSNVTFAGHYFEVDSVTVIPPAARRIPAYLATFGSEPAVRFATHPMFDCGLVGTYATVERELRTLEELGVTSVALRPVGKSLEENIAMLKKFRTTVETI